MFRKIILLNSKPKGQLVEHTSQFSNRLFTKQPNGRPRSHTTNVDRYSCKYVHCHQEKVYACFVDFRKAFHSVWHDGLLYKLLEINVGGNFYDLIKSLKTFTGYIQLKTSSFRLSGYSLQWIKNGKSDNYNKYKIRWNYKKNILKWEKNMYSSVNKLIVLFQKNRVLIRERPWIVICMTCRSGVPWF